MGAVISFGLKAIRKSCEDHNFISLACCFKCFCCKGVIVEIFVCRETFCIDNLCVRRNRIQRICNFETVDMGTSTTLETWFFGKTADESNFFSVFQRKNLSVVFQKNHGFLGNMTSFLMIFFHSEFLWCTVVCVLEDNAQDTLYSLIQYFFFQGTILYSLYDKCVIGTV